MRALIIVIPRIVAAFDYVVVVVVAVAAVVVSLALTHRQNTVRGHIM